MPGIENQVHVDDLGDLGLLEWPRLMLLECVLIKFPDSPRYSRGPAAGTQQVGMGLVRVPQVDPV
jgi:hypothetical protein